MQVSESQTRTIRYIVSTGYCIRPARPPTTGSIVTGGVGRRWYGCCKTELEVRIERTKIRISFKVVLLLAYTREQVKREEKEILQHHRHSLYIQFVCHLSNHSPCSDIPSESYPMILHTTPLFLIVTTTPYRPTSQHLRPLLYRTKLYRHHLAASSASSNVSAFP